MGNDDVFEVDVTVATDVGGVPLELLPDAVLIACIVDRVEPNEKLSVDPGFGADVVAVIDIDDEPDAVGFDTDV